MKTVIRDPSAVAILRPVEVMAYLRAKYWCEREAQAGRFSAWVYEADETIEALVPLDSELPDFALRMGDVLHTLAAVEQRSEPQILADLSNPLADVVRIGAGPETEDATLLEKGIRLLDVSRELFLAAACAAIAHQPAHRGQYPAQALEYLQGLRLGHTEPANSLITILSPVPPLLGNSDGDPFERMVTICLFRALEAAHYAAERVAATTSFDAFKHASGVSAELCFALSSLAHDLADPLIITCGWAPARPHTDESVPSRVSFDHGIIAIIEEAGRRLQTYGYEGDEAVSHLSLLLPEDEAVSRLQVRMFGRDAVDSKPVVLDPPCGQGVAK